MQIEENYQCFLRSNTSTTIITQNKNLMKNPILAFNTQTPTENEQKLQKRERVQECSSQALVLRRARQCCLAARIIAAVHGLQNARGMRDHARHIARILRQKDGVGFLTQMTQRLQVLGRQLVLHGLNALGRANTERRRTIISHKTKQHEEQTGQLKHSTVAQQVTRLF